MTVKTEFLEDTSKYWTITTTEKTNHYAQTRLLGVVAKTATEAIEKVTDKYPKIKITSCNHKGSVDLF